jgi:pilus assembly protein TadC
MELKNVHIIGIILSIVIVLASLFFIDTKGFFFMLGTGIVIGVGPFVVTIIYETRINTQKEEMFLEFARNLVESVKAGTPIVKSIVNLKKKSYGVLSENIGKLANQISIGISLGDALHTFSKDVNNNIITRALTLIGQAERAGGDIGGILESVAGAVSMSDKLRKERRANIQTLVVQGYIIFFVFIIIILVMQYKILPMVSGITETGIDAEETGFGFGGGSIDTKAISNSFLYLLLIQGFFSGMTIGKLTEGSLKYGVKHSFILVVSSFLIYTGTGVAFGTQ